MAYNDIVLYTLKEDWGAQNVGSFSKHKENIKQLFCSASDQRFEVISIAQRPGHNIEILSSVLSRKELETVICLHYLRSSNDEYCQTQTYYSGMSTVWTFKFFDEFDENTFLLYKTGPYAQTPDLIQAIQKAVLELTRLLMKCPQDLHANLIGTTVRVGDSAFQVLLEQTLGTHHVARTRTSSDHEVRLS